ncbi:MAG: PAS domain S-box protein, partial [Pseudomonadales bacterium]|nr:PAS domain S-box protein [Pseudomonadales bacterium]
MLDRFLSFLARITGRTAERDRVRRYHRQILQDLPTAACTIGAGGHVLTWNQAMAEVTGFSTEYAIGSSLSSLPEWGELLAAFVHGDELKQKRELLADGTARQINLQKARVGEEGSDTVIVVEDITEAELLEQQLVHKERLASIGQLAAGVAHEIGNPVTGIACLAQNLKIETGREEIYELSDQILEQTERISTILQSLVNFAHQGNKDSQPQKVPIDIRQCIDEAINLLSLNRKENAAAFVNQCESSLIVAGDPQRLCQVFVNILSNARDASSPGEDITISAHELGDAVSVEIIDRGHGISSAHLQHVFEPFYTTKDPGKGTGLGLAIVSSIIEEHDGSIVVDSPEDERGTCVLIRLPAWTPTSPELTSPPDS